MAQIDTAIIIHVPTEWGTTNFRYAFRALSATLPPHVGVLCVNRPVDLAITPLRHPRKFLTRFRTTHEESVSDRMRVITPRLLLHEQLAARLPAMTGINRRLLRSQLEGALHRWLPGVRKLIQWIHHPVQHWVYRVFPDAGRVYHCYDEYSLNWDGNFRPREWEREQQLLREADVTFVTSCAIMGRREGIARRLELLPNGIPDFFLETSHFRDEALERIPRPRIGFLGNVRNVLDFALMERVFAHRREWQMVFIGPVQSERLVRRLRRLPNVHFLGARPHEYLPRMLSRLDIGVMPFVVNEFTQVLQPHKMFELLSAGVPVVATDLQELRRFRSLVRLADGNAAAFEHAIAETLAARSERRSTELQQAARAYTWEEISRKHILPVLQQEFGI